MIDHTRNDWPKISFEKLEEMFSFICKMEKKKPPNLQELMKVERGKNGQLPDFEIKNMNAESFARGLAPLFHDKFI